MIEISKELLSEVFNKKVTSSRQDNNIEYDIYWEQDEDRVFGRIITFYELCHIMKEWIINKGYVLKICYVLENDTRDLAFIETTLLKSNQYLSDYYDMDSKTEIEAAIKACQWILDNKGIK